jgi:hypothetical protein
MTTLTPPVLVESVDLSLLDKHLVSKEAYFDDSSSTLDTQTDLQHELDLQDIDVDVDENADENVNVHIHLPAHVANDYIDCSDSSTPDSPNSPNSPNSPKSRKVRFQTVQIREYGITLGDNPSCSSGPPVQLDWSYNEITQEMTVEKYEKVRSGNRRCIHNMKIPSEIRYVILREWNVSRNEMVDVQSKCEAIKKQRSKVIRRYYREESLKYVTEQFKERLMKRLSCRDISNVVVQQTQCQQVHSS